MRADAALPHQQAFRRGPRGKLLGRREIGGEGFQVAVVHPDEPRGKPRRAVHFGGVVDFDQHIHRMVERGRLDLGHDAVIERRDDDQDGIGTERACFGDLPRVDHEILAQDGQVAGLAGGDEVILMALEIGRIGQHGKACRAPCGIGPGMRRRLEIGADQALRRRGFLDLGNKSEPVILRAGECSLKPARRGLRTDRGFEIGQRAFLLGGSHLFALGGADFFQLVHVKRSVRSSRAGGSGQRRNRAPRQRSGRLRSNRRSGRRRSAWRMR